MFNAAYTIWQFDQQKLVDDDGITLRMFKFNIGHYLGKQNELIDMLSRNSGNSQERPDNHQQAKIVFSNEVTFQ